MKNSPKSHLQNLMDHFKALDKTRKNKKTKDSEITSGDFSSN